MSRTREKGLLKLGVSEEDVVIAEALLSQTPPVPRTKAELLLGYSQLQLRRVKALKMLGISEEELEFGIRSDLSSLGFGGISRQKMGSACYGYFRQNSFTNRCHNVAQTIYGICG